MQHVDMEAIYAKTPLQEIPWDVVTPPDDLVQLVESAQVPRGRAVDFGCGTGNNSIYLARQGFEVTGVDVSPTAVGIARQRAQQQGVKCNFIVADVLGGLKELAECYDFALDWVEEVEAGKERAVLEKAVVSNPGPPFQLGIARSRLMLAYTP